MSMPLNPTITTPVRPVVPGVLPGSLITQPPLVDRVGALPLGDRAATVQALRTQHVAPEEFAPAYVRLAATSRAQAQSFAVAFADAMQSNDQIGRLYDTVARAPDADRRAVIDANKAAGQG